MKPVEFSRPWIASGEGRKIVAISLIVVITGFALLFALNSFGQGTVNLQQINILESGSISSHYSIPYGKQTYNSGSSIVLSIPLLVPQNATLPVKVVSVTSAAPFMVSTSGNIQFSSHGTQYLEIIVTMPGNDYAGDMNISVQLS